MEDSMFVEAEEDLHAFYSGHGKVDSTMSYRRRLSLNLMTADFIHLLTNQSFDAVLVMLGVDEHKYVRFAQTTLERMAHDLQFSRVPSLGGLYSPLISGFNNFPKMSKSFPESGITVDMSPDTIRQRIMHGEGVHDKPENNVVYQLIAGASLYSPEEVSHAYTACLLRGPEWEKQKKKYVDHLVTIVEKWK
jgi:tryptophanyl-tRNA synthetase